MIRWISGSKLSERRSNNELRKAIAAVIRRWEEGKWIRKVCELQVQGRRPRKTRKNAVKEDVRALRLKESDALNREKGKVK